MKKSFLSIVLGLATTIAFGQIDAGTKILGGTFSYYSWNHEVEQPDSSGAVASTKYPSSMITIVPSFMYMFKENMGAGIRVGIRNNSQGEGDNKIDDNLTIVGLYGRYYMPVAGDNLYFHTDLVIDLGFGSKKQGKSTTDHNTMMVGLQPGWDFFVGEKWALEMNWGWLGYSSDKWENTDSKVTETDTEFGLNFDFTSLSLGARWYF